MAEKLQRADVCNSPARSDKAEEAAWKVARGLRTFGYGELRAEVRLGEHHAREIVRKWVEEGRCERLSPSGQRKRLMFRVTADWLPRDAAGEVRLQLWTAMRLLRTFTPVDLTAHCSVEVSQREATDYCHALLAAEYLGVVQRATAGVRPATYRLLSNTGPSAPRPRRVTALFDDNVGAIVHVSSEVNR